MVTLGICNSAVCSAKMWHWGTQPPKFEVLIVCGELILLGVG